MILPGKRAVRIPMRPRRRVPRSSLLRGNSNVFRADTAIVGSTNSSPSVAGKVGIITGVTVPFHVSSPLPRSAPRSSCGVVIYNNRNMNIVAVPNLKLRLNDSTVGSAPHRVVGGGIGL